MTVFITGTEHDKCMKEGARQAQENAESDNEYIGSQDDQGKVNDPVWRGRGVVGEFGFNRLLRKKHGFHKFEWRCKDGKEDFRVGDLKLDHKNIETSYQWEFKSKEIYKEHLEKYPVIVCGTYKFFTTHPETDEALYEYRLVCWFESAEVLAAIESGELSLSHERKRKDGTPRPSVHVPRSFGKTEKELLARISESRERGADSSLLQGMETEMTPKQRQYLEVLYRELRRDPPNMRNWTLRQASQKIAELKRLKSRRVA